MKTVHDATPHPGPMPLGRIFALMAACLVFQALFVHREVIINNGDNLFMTVLSRTVFTHKPFYLQSKMYYMYRPDDPIAAPQYMKPPLFPSLLAVLFRVTGERFYLQVLLSALCASLTLLPLAAVSRLLFRRYWPGLWAGALYCTAPALLQETTTGMEGPLMVLLIVTAAWALLAADARGGLRLPAAAGLLTGLAWLTSYRALALIPAFLCVQWALALGRRPVARILRENAVFLACCLAAMLPWMLRNLHYFGNPLYNVGQLMVWQIHWNDSYAPRRYEPTLTHFLNTLGAGPAAYRFLRSYIGWLVALFQAIPFLLPPALALLALRMRNDRRLAALALPCVFMLLLLGTFTLSGGARYLNPLLPFLLIPGVAGFLLIAGAFAGDNAALPARTPKALTLCLVVVLTFHAMLCYQQNREERRDTSHALSRDAGAWLKKNTPADAVVMMAMPMAVNFHANRRGLQLPREVGIEFVEKTLDRYRADYFVDLFWENPDRPRGYKRAAAFARGSDRVTVYERMKR